MGDRSLRASRRYAEAFGDSPSSVPRKSPRLSSGGVGIRESSLTTARMHLSGKRGRPAVGEEHRRPPPPAMRKSMASRGGLSTM